MSSNKFTKEILDIVIKEAKKEKNIKIIEDDILAPLIDFILEKIKPYVIATSVFLITITLLIIVILFLVLTSGKKST